MLFTLTMSAHNGHSFNRPPTHRPTSVGFFVPDGHQRGWGLVHQRPCEGVRLELAGWAEVNPT